MDAELTGIELDADSQAVADIQEDRQDELLAKENVVGVGVGPQVDRRAGHRRRRRRRVGEQQDRRRSPLQPVIGFPNAEQNEDRRLRGW